VPRRIYLFAPHCLVSKLVSFFFEVLFGVNWESFALGRCYPSLALLYHVGQLMGNNFLAFQSSWSVLAGGKVDVPALSEGQGAQRFGIWRSLVHPHVRKVGMKSSLHFLAYRWG
jgi:hypothetical protein